MGNRTARGRPHEAYAAYSEEDGRKLFFSSAAFIVFGHVLNTSQLISKASKAPENTGLRVLDLACGKGGDLGKWAAHPDGIEKYVGSDIAFGSLEHLVERMASECGKGLTFLCEILLTPTKHRLTLTLRYI